MCVQYRVAFSKKDEAIEGPDDADVVVTIDAKAAQTMIAAPGGFDAEVAFMRGALKSTGSTAELFRQMRSGDVSAAITRLAQR